MDLDLEIPVGDYNETVYADQMFDHLVEVVHKANFARGWWEVGGRDLRPKSFDYTVPHQALHTILMNHIVATKIALIHSEISEGLEAFRKDLNDDKLTDRPGLEVELIDTIIRCLDLLGAFGYTAGETFVRVMQNNATRPDHDPAARAQKGGKKF
jgi:hypothetical protein